jgi:hypothetical protein
LEKFFPLIRLLFLFLLIFNLLLSCILFPGIFYLDFLVSSSTFFLKVPLKTLDFFSLSRIFFIRNSIKKSISSSFLIESSNYFFIFLFVLFFLLLF